MCVCWHCYWGWPDAIASIFEKYAERLGEDELHFGRGHIVWSDENFDDHSIEFCLNEATPNPGHEWSDDEIVASLRELLLVPAEMREVPEGYDDENPKDFPPPAEWKVRKRGAPVAPTAKTD
jgi:hypothetical protein